MIGNLERSTKNKNWFWAVLAGLILVSGYVAWDKGYRQGISAESWFLIRSINVADSRQGNDPPVIYDRTILSNFFASWSAEIHRAADGALVCTGRGQNDYNPEDKVPEGITLSWFLGVSDCALPLPAGQYYIEATWLMSIPNYPLKVKKAKSNIFTILPKEGAVGTYIQKLQPTVDQRAENLLPRLALP